MANRSSVIDHEDDLDLWEVVNPSEGEYSDDSFSVDSLSDDDVISPPIQILPGSDGGVLVTDLDLVDGDDDDDVDGEIGWFQSRMVIIGGGSRYSVGTIKYNGDEEDCGGVEDVVDYEYSNDLDDELVPRNVSRKLMRERLRKLGKRGIAKVFPYSQLKPGCVRGKYGLGLKFRC